MNPPTLMHAAAPPVDSLPAPELASSAVTRLRGVDALRCLAVALVILYHAGSDGLGGYGIPMLLVLSSFLVTRSFASEAMPRSFRTHFLRRFLRIGPAYYAFLIVTLSLDTWLGHGWSPGEVLAAFTHTVNVANMFDGHTHPIAHAWTLSVLEQFYLLAFLVLPTLLRLDVRRIMGLLLAVTVAVCLVRFEAYRRLGHPPHYIYNSLLCRLDMFMIGHVLARHHESMTRWLAPLPRSIAAFASALAALSISRANASFHYTLGFTVEAMCAAVMIVSIHGIATRVRMLDGAIVTRWARYSYGAYLWQMWSLAIARRMVSGPLARGAVGVLIAFSAGAIGFSLIERPFLDMRARVLAGGPLFDLG